MCVPLSFKSKFPSSSSLQNLSRKSNRPCPFFSLSFSLIPSVFFPQPSPRREDRFSSTVPPSWPCWLAWPDSHCSLVTERMGVEIKMIPSRWRSGLEKRLPISQSQFHTLSLPPHLSLWTMFRELSISLPCNNHLSSSWMSIPRLAKRCHFVSLRDMRHPTVSKHTIAKSHIRPPVLFFFIPAASSLSTNYSIRFQFFWLLFFVTQLVDYIRLKSFPPLQILRNEEMLSIYLYKRPVYSCCCITK